jgi:hypothetical protein
MPQSFSVLFFKYWDHTTLVEVKLCCIFLLVFFGARTYFYLKPKNVKLWRIINISPFPLPFLLLKSISFKAISLHPTLLICLLVYFLQEVYRIPKKSQTEKESTSRYSKILCVNDFISIILVYAEVIDKKLSVFFIFWN